MSKKTKLPLASPVLMLLLLALITCCNNRTIVPESSDNKIIVLLELSYNLYDPQPANYTLKEIMSLDYKPLNSMEYNQQKKTINSPVSNGTCKWTFYSSQPVSINYGFGRLEVVSPGDSIFIDYNGLEYVYTGKGAEKLKAWAQIQQAGKSLARPMQNNSIRSLNEYVKWSKYVDDKLSIQMPILESMKTSLSEFEYDYLKTNIVSQAESDRIQAFQALRSFSQRDSSLGLASTELNAIWDSTQYKPWKIWLSSHATFYGDIADLSEFNKLEVWRRFSFNKNNDSLSSKEIRNYLYYTNARQKFQGLLRERMLVGLLNQQIRSGKESQSSITKTLLKDYFSMPGFPEYKSWIKDLAAKIN